MFGAGDAQVRFAFTFRGGFFAPFGALFGDLFAFLGMCFGAFGDLFGFQLGEDFTVFGDFALFFALAFRGAFGRFGAAVARAFAFASAAAAAPAAAACQRERGEHGEDGGASPREHHRYCSSKRRG
ncbi:MAG TPA: hypothetical protein VMA83_07070 [Solirubrobacteraceae bacterium]|nr:hypothetical protein [Solirubrobacteraceae bacterium]